MTRNRTAIARRRLPVIALALAGLLASLPAAAAPTDVDTPATQAWNRVQDAWSGVAAWVEAKLRARMVAAPDPAGSRVASGAGTPAMKIGPSIDPAGLTTPEARSTLGARMFAAPDPEG